MALQFSYKLQRSSPSANQLGTYLIVSLVSLTANYEQFYYYNTTFLFKIKYIDIVHAYKRLADLYTLQ